MSFLRPAKNTYVSINADDIVRYSRKCLNEIRKTMDQQMRSLPGDIRFQVSFAEVTEDDGNYQCAVMVTAMKGEKTARLIASENQEEAKTPWTMVNLIVWSRVKAFSRKPIPGVYMCDSEWKPHFLRLMEQYVGAIRQYGLEPYEGDLGYIPRSVVRGPQ